MTRTRTLLGGVLLAAVTIGTWAAWLGWESGYRTDPRTGATSGPYTVWQVVGAVLTLVVVAAVAGWLLSPVLVAPVMTVAFTAAWSGHAAASTTPGSGWWGRSWCCSAPGPAAPWSVSAAISSAVTAPADHTPPARGGG